MGIILIYLYYVFIDIMDKFIIKVCVGLNIIVFLIEKKYIKGNNDRYLNSFIKV